MTEFLPVSSSGNLVVAEAAIGFSRPGVLVEVVLHVATLVAVVLVYWRTLLRLARGVLGGDRDAWRYVLLLAVATVPAGIAGVWFKDFFERLFESLFVVGIDFLITGTILWSTRNKLDGTAEPKTGQALSIGVAQAFAIFPGISRSGSTISVALWMGIDPVRAAEFSFLMAIPAIAGAAVLQIPELSTDVTAIGSGPLLLGFICALVSGVAAIRLLIVLLQRRGFHRFAPYCWALGLLTIGWALVR